MPMAQGDSGMWDKELRSAVGLSEKNGPLGWSQPALGCKGWAWGGDS